MADCFPPAPINPLNQLLLTVFGDNFFPPFNAGFQPVSKGSLVNEKLLQMSLPGGGKIKPTGEPGKTISEMLTPITGQLASVFAFFGPLFLILDLIRSIIDILCALFNPQPMIAALIEMFLTTIPPVIALFPPLSSILLALNAIKLIIAIIVGLTAAIIPIIDLIVENANSIASLIEEGNIGAIESVTTKICTLLEAFANELAALAPISFIIELIDLFMGLGGKLFCATDERCCDSASCPPIIMEPPTGSATVSAVTVRVSLKDLLSPINPLVLPTVLDPPIGIPLSAISAGLIPDLNIGPIELGELDLVPFLDDEALDSFEIVAPEMTISISDVANLATLNDYIVDPEKIPGASSEADPATVRVRITRNSDGTSITARALSATTTSITVKADDFEAGTAVSFEILPDKDSLIKLNLISLACDDDLLATREGLAARVAATSAGNGTSALDSVAVKLGRNFPPLPDFGACLAAQQADPTVSQAQCVFNISSDYLDDLKEMALDLICLGASREASEFISDREFVPADGEEHATVSLTIKDANGVNLLQNFLPNVNVPEDISVDFSTTLGTIGPVIFDAEEGVFRANITSDRIGTAQIQAAFAINGNVCMTPATFDGFSLLDKTVEIDFQRPGGTFPRRRRQAQYVQSAGGRRR